MYEAEQQNPKRAVAIKVIRGGRYVSERDVKLFQREAQALARLKHPSIAAMYEAGPTEAGQHFFAMGLVRGVRLVEYARSQDGTPAALVRQRLELFRDVCSAVSYAHQLGVIHRDLKPSNILVSPGTRPRGDGSTSPATPDVKILDFGLARITDPDGDGDSINTDLGAVAGTLPYMSPEQARGNSDEIDLRTDVYSLGVILYELLTGSTAVRRQHRQPASLGECLTALRRYEAAEALLLQAWPTVQSQLGAGHRESAGVLRNIIGLYEAWGKPQKAAEFRAQVPKLAQKS